MAFYPKKLRSIKDLEREQKLVLKQKKQLDKEDLLSLDGLLGKGKKGDDDEGGGGFDLMGTVMNLLPVSNPIVGMLIGLAKDRLFKKKDKLKYADDKKPGSSVFFRIGKELLLSYLKWKAVEASYKGLRYLVKLRKEKRETYVPLSK